MRFLAPARLLIIGIAAVCASVVGFGSGTASACSCFTPDPIEAVDMSDLVFTGTQIGGLSSGSERGWRIDVDGVVKGEVGDVVDLIDRGARECGTDYGSTAGSTVFYASERNDDIVAFGCMPILSRSAFEAFSNEFVERSGVGPPAALAIGALGHADMRVLDVRGQLLGAAELEGDPYAAAHCPGTPFVAVASLDAEFASQLSIVDIEKMEVAKQLDVGPHGGFELGVARGEIACFDGGERVVIATRSSGGVGQPNMELIVIDISTETSATTRTPAGVGGAVIHPLGNVILLPMDGGGELRTVAPDANADIGSPVIDLGEGVSVRAGSVSADGDHLALLVTFTAFERNLSEVWASHIVSFELEDGAPTSGTELVIELPAAEAGGGLGQPRSIVWVDDETFAVERASGLGASVDVIATDGSLTSSTEVDYGFGLVPLDDAVVRSSAAGLELIGSDGSSTESKPAAAPASSFFLAPIVDGEGLVVSAVPEFDPIEISDVLQRNDSETAPTDDPVDDGVVQSDSAGSDSGPSMVRGLIGAAVMIGVFVFGLTKIREQRRTGRTSKFPRIG